jgi:replicative DNA helicase
MPSLTQRAEEALLGALIYNPAQLDDVPHVRPDDFGDPLHRAVFTAIGQVRDEVPGAYGAAVTEAIAARADTARADELYLSGLVRACPDTFAAAIYGRMVQEAAFRRALAEHAGTLTQTAGSGYGTSRELDHLARLSAALQIHSHSFETVTSQSGGAVPPAMAGTTARQEELLLAGLIQNPETVGEIREWLDPEAFTAPDRRRIYEAIVAVDSYGEPVTELTLSWELGRHAAAKYVLDGEVPTGTGSGGHPSPEYLAKLGETNVEAGLTVIIGRDLHAGHVRSELTREAHRSVHPGHAGLHTSTGNSIIRQLNYDDPVLLQPPGNELGDNGRHLNMDQ